MSIRHILIVAVLLLTGCADLTSADESHDATPRTAQAGPPGFALAQVDPGLREIHQLDHLVGTIFVPDREPEACSYVEYWYLFKEYSYPGAHNLIATVIQPTEDKGFPDLESFEHYMGKVYPGGYIVEVEATEWRDECGG